MAKTIAGCPLARRRVEREMCELCAVDVVMGGDQCAHRPVLASCHWQPSRRYLAVVDACKMRYGRSRAMGDLPSVILPLPPPLQPWSPRRSVSAHVLLYTLYMRRHGRMCYAHNGALHDALARCPHSPPRRLTSRLLLLTGGVAIRREKQPPRRRLPSHRRTAWTKHCCHWPGLGVAEKGDLPSNEHGFRVLLFPSPSHPPPPCRPVPMQGTG